MTNNTQFKTLVNTWLNQKQPMITPSTHASFTLIAENHLIQQTDNDPMMDNLPWEVRDKVKSFQVNPQFREDIETLQIPQFFLKIEQSLFTDGSFELLDKEMLAEGFTLKGKAYDIDFATADDEIREIDVREQDGGLPKVFKMESAEQRYFKEWFNNLPPESRVRQCKDMMFNQLNKLNMVDAAELKAYINRIVDDMDKAQLAAMEKAPLGYAAKIRSKIETLLEAHYRENFERWLETERIVCKPYFRLRPSIHPATYTDIYARSLYAAEDGDMNKLEQKLIVELTALPNLRWWHRNTNPTKGLVKRNMKDIPVYRFPAAYARENNELELYRASSKANTACKEAIEKAISEHYYDNVLHKEAVAQVAEKFGYERPLYLLAITIRQKDWDGRFSNDNKAWAQTVPITENPDAWGTDRNCYLAINSHSGLVDLFTKIAREEAKAHERKPSVLEKLQKPLAEPKPVSEKSKGREL